MAYTAGPTLLATVQESGHSYMSTIPLNTVTTSLNSPGYFDATTALVILLIVGSVQLADGIGASLQHNSLIFTASTFDLINSGTSWSHSPRCSLSGFVFAIKIETV